MNRRELIKFGSLSMTLPALSFAASDSKPMLPMKEKYSACWKFDFLGDRQISLVEAKKTAQFLCEYMDARGVWRGHPMEVIYLSRGQRSKSDPLGQCCYFGCISADESGLESAYRAVDADGRLLITEFAKLWHGV